MRFIYTSKSLQERSIQSSSNVDSLLDEIIAFNEDLNQFKYGLEYKGRIIQGEVDPEDYDKFYHMASPKEFEEQGGGVCWDYTTYEADYFTRHFPEIDFKCWFVYFDDGQDMPTHTFLTFEYDEQVYYIESSFGAIQGVYVADDESNIISFVLESMIDYTDGNVDLSGCAYYVFSYDALDPELIGKGCYDFMNYVINTGEESFLAYIGDHDVTPI